MHTGAAYRIVVPADWNGTLIVYAHGYRDKADHPGEVDDTSAGAAPSAALESALVGAGYAVAGSAFESNGWAVKEGIDLQRDPNLCTAAARALAPLRAANRLM